MADEKKDDNGSAMGEVWLLLGFFAALVALWFYVGGPGRTDLRGLFLSPPQPLGSGSAYGPQLGSDGSTTSGGQQQPQTYQQQIEVQPGTQDNSGYYLQQQN